MSEYKLLIVESPSKAKTIQKYLGSGWQVIASNGHIMDLPASKLGIDIHDGFEMDLTAIKGKEEKIKEVKNKAKGASEIYLAPDPDREGEAIAFHLYQVINRKKNVFRVTFNQITKGSVQKAVANPKELNLEMYESQKTRRILDRLVGYKISPVLWKKITSGLSAGRVQSVALRIVLEREQKIRAFKPENWFTLSVMLEKDDIKFKSQYYGSDKDNKNTLNTQEEADEILKNLDKESYIVDEIIKESKKQKPTPAFTTSKMQQEAGNKLGFSTKQTMQVAQKLYEGKNLGDLGTQGLITYMRTDSVRSAPEAVKSLREYIESKYGKEYLPEQEHVYDSKGGKVQDAHEAIRPTSMELTPETVKVYLSAEEFKLYQLIWNKFVSSQMKEAEIDKTTVWIKNKDYFFKSTGTILTFDGFKHIYEDTKSSKKSKKGESEEEESSLPNLNKYDKVKEAEKPEVKENWTKPPQRYTEVSLVAALEKKGIGRPSTYAAIISNITDRGYVLREKKYLYPSELGEVMCLMLIDAFPREMDIKFTAEMEKRLDDIEEGTHSRLEVLKEFWKDFEENLKKAYKIKSIKPLGIPYGQKCEKCTSQNTYITTQGSNSYLTCFDCGNKSLIDLNNFNKIEKKEVKADMICDKCGSPMELKNGSYGKFYGCSGYSTGCRNTKPFIQESDVKCYSCRKGTFIPRKSKKGNTYYACSNGNCKAMVWNKPINLKCVHCTSPMLTEVKRGNKKSLICPKCERYNPPK